MPKTDYATTERDADTSPGALHLVLPVTQTVVRTFRNQRDLMSYRRMVYSINKQGEFRYRTIRAEDEMWGLVIWRMV